MVGIISIAAKKNNANDSGQCTTYTTIDYHVPPTYYLIESKMDESGTNRSIVESYCLWKNLLGRVDMVEIFPIQCICVSIDMIPRDVIDANQ